MYTSKPLFSVLQSQLYMCLSRLLRCLRRPSRKRIYQLDEHRPFDIPSRPRNSLPVRSEISLFLYQVNSAKLQGGIRPLHVQPKGKLTAKDRRFFYSLMLRRKVRQEVPLERLSEFTVLNGVLMLGTPLGHTHSLSRRSSV